LKRRKFEKEEKSNQKNLKGGELKRRRN